MERRSTSYNGSMERRQTVELYQLDYVLHEPSEEHGGLYMAEVPELPGCRAWAATAKETLHELSTVAEQFILSYKDRGKPLPESIAHPTSPML